MKGASFNIPEFSIIQRHKWLSSNLETKKANFEAIKNHVGLPFVTKSANQGSSIGAGVLWEDDFEEFDILINQSLFLQKLEKSDWQAKNEEQKISIIKNYIDENSNFQNIVDYFEKYVLFLRNNTFNNLTKDILSL